MKGILPDNLITVDVKPLSVNEAWQGKRFKTPKYKEYEETVLLLLPKFNLPEGPLQIVFDFGFSNQQSDVDNPTKPFLDILQKKYGFNDSRVYRVVLNKHIVPKGQEYVKFNILPYIPN